MNQSALSALMQKNIINSTPVAPQTISEPDSPESYPTMPNINVNGTSNFTVEEEPGHFEKENISMTIESTPIRNHSVKNQQIAYHYKVLVQGDSGFWQVYTSRKTILDRPCWRDDQVSLDSTMLYRIEIFSTA